MQQTFNDLIKQDVKPFLLEHGFVRKGLNFYRSTDALTYIINIQKSSGNTVDRVMFYVNCGIYSPELATIQGKTIQSPPTEVECHFRSRIESIATSMPARFELTEDIDVEIIRQTLRDGLEEVIRFFEQMTNARSIVDYYRTLPALHMSEEGLHLLLQSGAIEEARTYVAALRDKHGEENRWSIFEAKYQAIFDEYGEALGAE
ncbi:DUF4304 domain-containing protein [Paenibacillus daejeonensis]|uniref:DUF4304 domain-containing protein n=1 Tax=Paenibacillus daejeonensis TaxID=135193 RepID=UPI00037A9607|nr:DUF4304 domain-containing protein [Paenibacillus daejeonensis]